MLKETVSSISRAYVLSLFVANKLLVRHTDLAISEPLPLSPCDVLRNAPAFLLHARAHFIDKILTIRHDNAIISDIISIAYKLGHCTVAEGVIYEEQNSIC